jgi:hypothetical protein
MVPPVGHPVLEHGKRDVGVFAGANIVVGFSVELLGCPLSIALPPRCRPSIADIFTSWRPVWQEVASLKASDQGTIPADMRGICHMSFIGLGMAMFIFLSCIHFGLPRREQVLPLSNQR